MSKYYVMLVVIKLHYYYVILLTANNTRKESNFVLLYTHLSICVGANSSCYEVLNLKLSYMRVFRDYSDRRMT